MSDRALDARRVGHRVQDEVTSELEIPGRRQTDRWIALALLVVFFAIRVPLRTRFLVNWDAVNFALGVSSFDVGHHQPHAPGYIGYVWIGRLLTWLVGDPNSALTLLSVIGGAVLTAAFYLLARRFMPRRYAVLTTLLIGTSPVVWYYSVVALTYVVAAAVAVPIAWAAHVARTERSPRHLYLAAVLLAVLGSLRQTDLALMLPLLIWAAWPFAWRTRIRAGALLTGVTLVWLVPLLVAAGGPVNYVQYATELAALAGGSTWVFSGNWVGMLQNIGMVGIGLLLGLTVALLVIPPALIFKARPLRDVSSTDRRFLALWGVPALLTYLFIHTGQLGYVLTVLPICFIWVGGALARVVASVRVRIRHRQVNVPRLATSLGVASAIVVLNTMGFLLLPEASYALLGPRGNDAVHEVAGSLVNNREPGVAERTRQYNLDANDDYWGGLTELVESFDPDEVALLGVPTSVGSFRHLAYYLPDYRVYGIGHDRQGRFGHLFTARDGENDYTVEGLDEAERELVLPEGVSKVVIPDSVIASKLADDVEYRSVYGAGVQVVVIEVPEDSMLRFRWEQGEAVLEVAPASQAGRSASEQATRS